MKATLKNLSTQYTTLKASDSYKSYTDTQKAYVEQMIKNVNVASIALEFGHSGTDKYKKETAVAVIKSLFEGSAPTTVLQGIKLIPPNSEGMALAGVMGFLNTADNTGTYYKGKDSYYSGNMTDLMSMIPNASSTSTSTTSSTTVSGSRRTSGSSGTTTSTTTTNSGRINNRSNLTGTTGTTTYTRGTTGSTTTTGTTGTTTTSTTLENQSTADFYINLYNAISSKGWVRNSSITNKETLQNGIKNGNVYIEQLQSDGSWKTTSESDSGTPLSEVSDSTAIAKAEAQYEAAKDKLDSKEKKIDLDMKNLDTERSALDTEIDSVKTIISKNIERSFKLFQA